jgi:hypothetical protein
MPLLAPLVAEEKLLAIGLLGGIANVRALTLLSLFAFIHADELKQHKLSLKCW